MTEERQVDERPFRRLHSGGPLALLLAACLALSGATALKASAAGGEGTGPLEDPGLECTTPDHDPPALRLHRTRIAPHAAVAGNEVPGAHKAPPFLGRRARTPEPLLLPLPEDAVRLQQTYLERARALLERNPGDPEALKRELARLKRDVYGKPGASPGERGVR